MSSVKARRYVLRSQFSGMPKREDLELVEEELPPLKDGGGLLENDPQETRQERFIEFVLSLLHNLEFLCEAQWLSVDPYMRWDYVIIIPHLLWHPPWREKYLLSVEDSVIGSFLSTLSWTGWVVIMFHSISLGWKGKLIPWFLFWLAHISVACSTFH